MKKSRSLFKSIAITSSLSLLLFSNTYAVDNDSKASKGKKTKKELSALDKYSKYMAIGITGSISKLYIDSPAGTKMDNTPVVAYGAKVILFPNRSWEEDRWYNNITIGYTKTFLKVGDEMKEARQIDFKFPIKFLEFIYKDYKYLTDIYSKDNSDLTIIEEDDSSFLLPDGQKYVVETRFQKIEGRLGIRIESGPVKNSFVYIAAFRDVLKKPLANPELTDGEKIIFAGAKLKSTGGAIGLYIDPMFTSDGFFISALRFSYAKTKVDLTDSKDLENYLPGYEVNRWGFFGRVSYKKELGFSKNNFFLINIFAFYFYYDVSDKQTNASKFDLSEDKGIGAEASIFF